MESRNSALLITAGFLLVASVCTAAERGEKYPQTQTRLITEEEAASMTYAELRYAINEMYARHGADFPSQPAIANRFRQFRWYHPKKGVSISEIETEFTETERANVLVLAKYRDQKQGGGSNNPPQGSLEVFEGTWTVTDQLDESNGVRVHLEHTLVIGNGTAVWTRIRKFEFVGGKLLQGKPAIFESYPRFTIETRSSSRDLRLDGSVLCITWAAEPAAITRCEPAEALEQFLKAGFAQPSESFVSRLKFDYTEGTYLVQKSEERDTIWWHRPQ